LADFVLVPVKLDQEGFILALDKCSNRYWRWGGRGFCLGAEKTRSEENAWKSHRIPSVQCTLC